MGRAADPTALIAAGTLALLAAAVAMTLLVTQSHTTTHHVPRVATRAATR